MIATEVDKKSLTSSKQLLDNNTLIKQVKLVQSEASGPILPLTVLKAESDALTEEQRPLLFSLSNPPFFSSDHEAEKTRRNVNSYKGTYSELICAGGEVDFILKQITETLENEFLQDNFLIFTSMVGMKKHLITILEFLQNQDNRKQIQFVSCATLRQGITFRWAVAWSFFPNPYSSQVDNPSLCNQDIEKMLERMKPYEIELSYRDFLTDGSETDKDKSLNKQSFMERIDEFFYQGHQRFGYIIKEIYRGEAHHLQGISLFGVAVSTGDSGSLKFLFQTTASTDGVLFSLLDEVNGDRTAFHKMLQHLKADIKRDNRYWRRKLQFETKQTSSNLVRV